MVWIRCQTCLKSVDPLLLSQHPNHMSKPHCVKSVFLVVPYGRVLQFVHKIPTCLSWQLLQQTVHPHRRRTGPTPSSNTSLKQLVGKKPLLLTASVELPGYSCTQWWPTVVCIDLHKDIRKRALRKKAQAKTQWSVGRRCLLSQLRVSLAFISCT